MLNKQIMVMMMVSWTGCKVGAWEGKCPKGSWDVSIWMAIHDYKSQRLATTICATVVNKK